MSHVINVITEMVGKWAVYTFPDEAISEGAKCGTCGGRGWFRVEETEG